MSISRILSGDMKMIKKIKIRLLHWLLDDYIDDILTHYTSEVIKPCIRNTKEVIDYLNTDEDGDEFFSVKMNGMSFK